MYEFVVSRVDVNGRVFVKNKNNNEYIVEKERLTGEVEVGDKLLGYVVSGVFYPKQVVKEAFAK